MSYFASHEKPVFLNFLNREANYASKALRAERIDIEAIDVLTLTHCCGMTANLSQMIEYSHNKKHLTNVIIKLIESGILISTSHSTDREEFIESRQRIYRNVSNLYPMYFTENANLDRFPIVKRNTFSMTRLLRRDIFDYDSSKFLNLGSHALDTDIKNFESGIDLIRDAIMKNADIAVTRGNIEKVSNKNAFSDPALSSIARVFSARYFDHYKLNNDAVIPSGIGLVGFLDELKFFPQYDLPVLKHSLDALGWSKLLSVRDIRSHVYANYATRQHRDFVLILNSLIAVCYSEVIKRSNRTMQTDNVDTVRRMVCNRLGSLIAEAQSRNGRIYTSFDEFLEISIETIQNAVQQESGRNKMFGEEWEKLMGANESVTILFLTATDTEDDAVRKALLQHGYKDIDFRSAGKNVAREYRRVLNQRVFHVRSSAGSTGSSGSELTAYDAIEALRPDYTIAVGICFGLKDEKQAIGDVLVSDKVTDYEMVRKGATETIERGTRVPSASKLLSASRQLRSEYSEGSPKVHHGEILSGMKLIDDSVFRTELTIRFPDAIGGEMEATGIAASASRISSDWIIIKAICDWAQGKGDGDQKLAAENAAEFSVKLVSIVFSLEIAAKKA